MSLLNRLFAPFAEVFMVLILIGVIATILTHLLLFSCSDILTENEATAFATESDFFKNINSKI